MFCPGWYPNVGSKILPRTSISKRISEGFSCQILLQALDLGNFICKAPCRHDQLFQTFSCRIDLKTLDILQSFCSSSSLSCRIHLDKLDSLQIALRLSMDFCTIYLQFFGKVFSQSILKCGPLFEDCASFSLVHMRGGGHYPVYRGGQDVAPLNAGGLP